MNHVAVTLRDPSASHASSGECIPLVVVDLLLGGSAVIFVYPSRPLQISHSTGPSSEDSLCLLDPLGRQSATCCSSKLWGFGPRAVLLM